MISDPTGISSKFRPALRAVFQKLAPLIHLAAWFNLDFTANRYPLLSPFWCRFVNVDVSLVVVDNIAFTIVHDDYRVA